MNDPVVFTIYGKPAQQGSKSAFMQHGKIRMIEQNDSRKKEWRQSVVCAGQEAMNGRERIVGPVRLEVTFFFRRPKSHYGSGKKSTTLKSSSPRHHAQTPDLDKLVRNIGDSLTGVVVFDDSQVCILVARRSWTEESERAEVRVEELDC